MTVFHWLVILIVGLSLLMHGERRKNLKFILIACVLMYCVFGLRDAYTVGIDTTGPYISKYEWVCKRDLDNMPTLKDWFVTEDELEDANGHSHNIGLDWAMRIYYNLTGGSYQGFIEFHAALFMIAFTHFIYRHSTSPIQSILLHFGLLFYTFHFSALKQSFAMAILLFSLDAIIERKPLRFIIIVLFASMFHVPALVFLPAYWIANMSVGRSYLIVLTLAFAVTYLLRDQLVEWMTDVYSTGLDGGPQTRFLANKVIVMIFILLLAVVIRPPSPDDRVYSSFLMLTGIAAVIQTFAGYNNTFERLADYYFQTSVVFIPMIFENVKTRRQYLSDDLLGKVRQFAPYLVCAFAIWRFWDVVKTPSSGMTPYHFYFDKKTAEDALMGVAFFLGL